MFLDILSSDSWTSIDLVEKGWSGDIKYKIKTKDNHKLLLRISQIENYAKKFKEFEIIQKYHKTGIAMSIPIEFGVCDQATKSYMILSWLDGQDLEEVLPSLSEKEQYQLGLEAGKILKTIHTIKVDKEDISTIDQRQKRLDKLKRYEDSDLRIANDQEIIAYVKDNIDKICIKDPVYQHGDFHAGNLVYDDQGNLGVIDFNRWDVADPYEEFYKLQMFTRNISTSYCKGQVDGYFDSCIPDDFWMAQSVYVAYASLYSIFWAKKFGQDEIDSMIERAKINFEDYDNFTRIIPRWYEK